MSNKLVPMPQKNPDQASQTPQLPELFTHDEVINLGEVISTTEAGCIFVLADDNVTLYQPVARHHFNDKEFYYNKVEFR